MAENSHVLEYFLSCQICFKTLIDPVSLDCNHNFCKMCLCKSWDQVNNRSCPVCQKTASTDMPQVNLTLKGLADTFAGRTQDGENGDAEANQELLCSVHIVKPSWFCMTENRLICEGCESVKKHTGHRLMRLKEIVENMKQAISLDMSHVKQQLCECKDVEEAYLQMEKVSVAQRALVERKIKKEFEQLHQYLREEEEARLAAVRQEAERKMMIIERELKIVQGHIHALTEAIWRVEYDLAQDNLKFYKNRSQTKARAQCTLQDPHVVSGALIDVAKHLGNLKFQVWRKMTEIVKYNPVILDPNTADGWLCLSEDLTSVKEMRTKQEVPDNPERFTKYIYVLGSEGFTSGKHCWDVDVGNRNRWSLGMASESVERKDETYLESKFGFWTIWMSEYKCTVNGMPIALEKRPETVRIQLDYEKGELSFYDADEKTHIYTYKTTFKDKLYPFFSTETDESKSAIKINPCTLSLITNP